MASVGALPLYFQMTDEQRKANARERMRRYRLRHKNDPAYKARVREEKRKQYERNPETRKASSCRRAARYRAKVADTEEFKAKAAERTCDWRKRNPERARAANIAWAQANPDASKEAARRYRERNPDAYQQYELKRPGYSAAAAAKRRAQKRLATPVWSDLNKIEAVYRDAKRISEDTGAVWHVDHIVPLKHKLVCGLHVPANLQILPGIENIRKNNRFTPS